MARELLAVAKRRSVRNGKGGAPHKLKEYQASIHQCDPEPLPGGFVAAIQNLEALLAMPVWFIIQNGECEYANISFKVYKGFQTHRLDFKQGKPVALILDSPGGDPDMAYRIARLFQRRSSDFVVLVPQYAKSAATLIALGANHLLLGRDAELGPLDIQIPDRDREETVSALETVQSLERLSAFSLRTIDQVMHLLSRRSAKRTDVLMPMVMDYAAKFVKPLLDKIDTVDYTQKSRQLKLAEEYAVRLMRENYPEDEAKEIVNKMVENYPTHGFVIDKAEADGTLGLRISETPDEIEAVMQDLIPFLDKLNVAGRLKEKA